MLLLSSTAEAALASSAIADEPIPSFDSQICELKPYFELREAGLVSFTTDWSQTIVVGLKLSAQGRARYQEGLAARRRRCHLTASADELICHLVALEEGQRIRREQVNPLHEPERADDYRELEQSGLVRCFWADNEPRSVALTQEGRAYVAGNNMVEEPSMNIQFNPVFNNLVNANTTTSASAATGPIDLSPTLVQLQQVDASDEVKTAAEGAAQDLKTAAEKKDVSGFATALKNAATIVESTSTIGSVLLPLAAELIGTLF